MRPDLRAVDRSIHRRIVVSAIALLALSLPGPTVAQDEDASSFGVDAEPGSGEGVTVGYISLGDMVPFVADVSASIREQAEIAGVELLYCDSGLDPAVALACAEDFAEQGVDGVINFQFFTDAAPDICAAYGGVPTVAVEIAQPPCQDVIVGADNAEAGRIGGDLVGAWVAEAWGCRYDAWLSLGATSLGPANADRMDGFHDGFREHCPLDPETDVEFDGGDTAAGANQQVAATLAGLDGERIIIVTINEDGAIGAHEAARSMGREGDVVIASQGLDPIVLEAIACDPRFIGSVDYFPQHYGTMAIPAVLELVAGEDVRAALRTIHRAVTAENVRDAYPDTPACAA